MSYNFCIAFRYFSIIMLYLLVTPVLAERIDRGSQVIDGTRVKTSIYHERGYAVFENDCGSQRLSQSALQRGAKPTDIIPCPRPSAEPQVSEESTESSDDQITEQSPPKRLWSAVAAGFDESRYNRKVGAGHASNHKTRSAAENAAVNACEKLVPSCEVVTAWNSGCYFITVSEDAEPMAWGAGTTGQRAYDECYSRIKSGNCKTRAIGNCYPE